VFSSAAEDVEEHILTKTTKIVEKSSPDAGLSLFVAVCLCIIVPAVRMQRPIVSVWSGFIQRLHRASRGKKVKRFNYFFSVALALLSKIVYTNLVRLQLGIEFNICRCPRMLIGMLDDSAVFRIAKTLLSVIVIDSGSTNDLIIGVFLFVVAVTPLT